MRKFSRQVRLPHNPSRPWLTVERLEDRTVPALVTELPLTFGTALPANVAAGPAGDLWFTENGANKIGRLVVATGAITEYTLPTANSAPNGIVLGPDGAMWFTEFGTDRIGRIDTAGNITEFQLAAGAGPLNITAGPDGTLWFTEAAVDRIGRITTGGVVSEFSAGIAAGSTPTDIVTGPDGRLWFTENTADRIAAITTAGVVSEFATFPDGPLGITSGPDGNVWFTASEQNGVGFITPNGLSQTIFGGGITAGSTPTDIVSGSDGRLWFTEPGANQVAAITTGGTVTEFAAGITAGSAPTGITNGPDNRLWFTEPGPGAGDGQLGATTTAGVVQELALIAAPPPAPTGIVTGPDGNLWFTETGSNKIGRIAATTGRVIEHYLPTPLADPRDITVGPDGNLWFTELGADRIGRITPGGVITEVPVTVGSGPLGITTGPDGALWFTGAANDTVNRITTAGVLTDEFAVPGLGSTPTDITVGRDGNLWFTEFGSDEVGRVTTAGVVTEFALPAGRGPLGVASGPDGLIYFTENTGDRIGRLRPDAGTDLAIQGSIIEFLVPGAGSGPANIVTGEGPALYFTEMGSAEIGRINPNGGIITEVSAGITAGSGPNGTAVGPDFNIWFTETNANQIGVLAVLAAAGTNIIVREDTSFTTVVATFVGGGFNSQAGDFTAVIDWGDGTPPTAGTISALGNGRFSVTGTHTYASSAAFPLTVTVTDTADGLTATANGTAFVTTIVATGVTFTATATVPFTGTVANFSEQGFPGVPGTTAGEYAATINWGDGTPLDTTSGVVMGFGSPGSGSSFFVQGTHPYALPGTFSVIVTITHVPTNYTVTAQSTGIVTAAPPPPTTGGTVRGTKFNDLDGDGTRDAGEPGLAGFTIFLDANGSGTFDPGEVSAVTAADGSYALVVAANGTYTVREVQQAGFTQTTPNPAPIALSGGATVSGIDFGNRVGQVRLFAVGAGPGGGPQVNVYNLDGSLRASFFAYDDGFQGGVTVATGDVNGDGVEDVITGVGRGGSPHVKVFSGVGLELLQSFFAYDESFAGGVFVAAGDVNGDRRADVVTGAGRGGSPHVKVFNAVNLAQLQSFFAYDESFAGGVRVAAGDVNGDGTSDVITGAGRGGGPHVRAFGGAGLALLLNFYAYDGAFTGGLYLAAADVNRDGKADVIAGPGRGMAPVVQVFESDPVPQGPSGFTFASFLAYDPSFTGGVTVAAEDLDGDGVAEVLTGPGRGTGPNVKAFDVVSLAVQLDFLAFDKDFRGGVFVG